MRIFTCTPICFKGDHTFFSRDSGLLSVGLTLDGIESRAVMPGKRMPGDDPRLIRTDYCNLVDYAWWKKQSIDAVVLFSWAMPEYTNIAEAIKASGAKLLIFLDSAGFWSPWSDGSAWFKAQWNSCTRKRGHLTGAIRFCASFMRSCVPNAFDKPRLNQMNLADAVTVTSPMVLERTRNFATFYRYEVLANKMHLLPLPVSTEMIYKGQRKSNKVVCVARWLPQDWPEKGPQLLLSALALFLGERPDYEALVVGRGASCLRTASFCPPGLRSARLRLIDYVPNKDLAPLLGESKISVCTSFHESYHIASFEAACCGCSAVALDSPDLPALQFLVHTNGTFSRSESPRAFANALLTEAGVWDRSGRDPSQISEYWRTKVHADVVARTCVEILQSTDAP